VGIPYMAVLRRVAKAQLYSAASLNDEELLARLGVPTLEAFISIRRLGLASIMAR